jgi:hypothetical protein
MAGHPRPSASIAQAPEDVEQLNLGRCSIRTTPWFCSWIHARVGGYRLCWAPPRARNVPVFFSLGISLDWMTLRQIVWNAALGLGAYLFTRHCARASRCQSFRMRHTRRWEMHDAGKDLFESVGCTGRFGLPPLRETKHWTSRRT